MKSGVIVKGDLPMAPDGNFQLSGAGGEVVLGKDVKLIGLTKVTFRKGGGRLVVEDGVELRGSFNIGNGSSVTIGSGSRINRHCLFYALEGANIVLGRDCLLSNSTLRTCDMHSLLDGSGRRINPSRSIVLEDRVWLAENTYISKGVRIGHDSVVAANSVVVKAVEPHTVVGGNPAKTIKTGISWLQKRIPMPASAVDDDPG